MNRIFLSIIAAIGLTLGSVSHAMEQTSPELMKAIFNSGEITKDIKHSGASFHISVSPVEATPLLPSTLIIHATWENTIAGRGAQWSWAYIVPQQKNEDQASYLARIQAQKHMLINEKVNEIESRHN